MGARQEQTKGHVRLGRFRRMADAQERPVVGRYGNLREDLDGSRRGVGVSRIAGKDTDIARGMIFQPGQPDAGGKALRIPR